MAKPSPLQDKIMDLLYETPLNVYQVHKKLGYAAYTNILQACRLLEKKGLITAKIEITNNRAAKVLHPLPKTEETENVN